MDNTLSTEGRRIAGYTSASLNSIRPPEWMEAALPHFQSFLPLYRSQFKSSCLNLDCPHFRSQAQLLSEELWEKRTGVKAVDSHFTIVFPVHNEAACLESVLDSFLAAHLPQSVHAQVIFVSNACDDRSPSIIQEFLTRLGKPEGFDTSLLPEYSFRQSTKVSLGSIDILHLDINTASKPMALNIANSLALSRGHKIVISIDANNWVEPDALPALFADCHRLFFSQTEKVVALDGNPLLAFRTERGLYPRLQKSRLERLGGFRQNGSPLCGWMMGWDAKWLQEQGGVPHLILDDQAISLLAARSGRNTRQSAAGIWGYVPDSLPDHFEVLVRLMQGSLQVRRFFKDSPEAMAILGGDDSRTSSAKGRFRHALREIFNSPYKAPFYLARSLAREAALLLAKRRDQREPDAVSWKSIASTKGE